MSEFGPPSSPQVLQFQRAEPVEELGSREGSSPSCAACKQYVAASQDQKNDVPGGGPVERGNLSVGRLPFAVITVATIAPLLRSPAGISALVSLFILLICLQQAWSLSARCEIPVRRPYQTDASQ